MKNISLEELMELIENTEFIRLFRPLLGYEDEVTLYQGIDDSLESSVDDIEELVGFEMPGDYLQVLLLSNGFKIFDLSIFSITAKKNDKNGLYFMNTKSDLRKKYGIPDDFLIIGQINEKFAVCLLYDNDGFITYSLWDMEKKEISISYDYLVEIIMSEIDYHTDAFSGE